MNITVPIYIELRPQVDTSPGFYLIRPLFFQEPDVRDEDLQRALAKFVKAMRNELDEEGRKPRHNLLAAYSFAPEFDEQLLSLSLNLKTRTANCKFLFVTLSALGGRIAFTPSLPDLWFEVERGEDFQMRAVEVLTDYYRTSEKSAGQKAPKPEDISVQNKAWSTTVEVEIHPPLLAKTPKDEFRALLGGKDVLDGELELQLVGRCLDWLYPNELSRVIAREHEVEQLTRLMQSSDNRPTLLLGPRMVGKTAIIEEFVYRMVAQRKSKFKAKNNVWLIAPQRLISGMSYLGQWENRLLAIIKEAKARKHILYFDDLLGLFRAGISRDSNLNVAQVLKPYIERREVRVLGEINPEAWQVLRERDRGFADLFQILPITEPDEETTLEMLLGLIRQLEHQHRCQFQLEALPAAIDLQRRYVRDAAFPGKAAGFLRQLAIKYRGTVIDREATLAEFQAKSGLALWFLSNANLSRSETIEALSNEVSGQPAAIEAIADVISVAKARLNDPDRPIASLLFLGPTGVGKTQCAKSLARYLFSNAERLIRLDMNEFVSPSAVARLTGTFDQPEGLLTSAVRRQPFSVVLLDEIEKAHRDVFNLLLQVMGDGRLTDALGQTSVFTNVILIMTSNLGVKEAGSELGFSLQHDNEASIYTQAAEKFFSPEFFNRINRIVPFGRLSRETVKRIAAGLFQEVFRREGLARRKCILNVDDPALEKIVDSGFHPQLGARALKRAIEKELAESVATHLSAFQPSSPAVIDVLPAAGGLRIVSQELIDAEPHSIMPVGLLENPRSTLERIDKFLSRAEEQASVLQPAGAISLDAIQPQHRRYFTLREQIVRLRRSRDRLRYLVEAETRPAPRVSRNYFRAPRRKPNIRYLDHKPRQLWKTLFAADDMHAFLQELSAPARSSNQELSEQLAETLREAALLSILLWGRDTKGHEQALIMIYSPHRSETGWFLSEVYHDLFANQLGMEVKHLDDGKNKVHKENWILVHGWQAVTLAELEAGTQLFIQHEIINLTQVRVFTVDPLSDPSMNVAEYRAKAGILDNIEPVKFDPVIRIHHGFYSLGPTIDLRSGLTTSNFPSSESFRAFLLSSLTLPDELVDLE